MTTRTDLLESMANTIQDYRAGEIAKPTSEHVDRWVKQFDKAVQVPLLQEIDHVLKKTYFSMENVGGFLKAVSANKKLAGDNPVQFWKNTKFLDIQGGGNSQHDMLAMFGQLLNKKFNLNIAECGQTADQYVYLDDGLFTGNRTRQDLEKWIREEAPTEGTLHIIYIALHSGGQYYASNKIKELAKSLGKTIDIQWWRSIELEDRKAQSYNSDVLRPVSIPEDSLVQNYVTGMTYPPTLRTAGSVGVNKIFSSDTGRQLLEQEFLKAGVKIRKQCPHLGDTQRPLGHMTLVTLGFGSLIATFRNCPNNAPLALWAGDPWHPLFPRTTNTQTAMRRLMEDLF